MTLTELADRIGMTLANLSILKTGKARAIRFSTLNAICRALSCQPGDILRFEPDADGWTSFWLNLPCDFELCESSQPFIVLKRVR
jgi:putative transcriptional regulator